MNGQKLSYIYLDIHNPCRLGNSHLWSSGDILLLVRSKLGVNGGGECLTYLRIGWLPEEGTNSSDFRSIEGGG